MYAAKADMVCGAAGRRGAAMPPHELERSVYNLCAVLLLGRRKNEQNPAAVRHLFDTFEVAFGGVDVLANNASHSTAGAWVCTGASRARHFGNCDFCADPDCPLLAEDTQAAAMGNRPTTR